MHSFCYGFYEFSREGYQLDAIQYLIKQEKTFESERRDCIMRSVRIQNRRQMTRYMQENYQ